VSIALPYSTPNGRKVELVKKLRESAKVN